MDNDDVHRGSSAGSDIHIELVDSCSFLNDGRRRTLVHRLTRAVEALHATGEVRVRVVADAEMAAAHVRYSGVEGTTDVLTFDMRDCDDADAPLDVDLWVCIDEANRQAEARGIDTDRELLLYCIHGVLHCLGHDDHTDEGFERMHAEEDRLLEAIGVGRTFALAADARRDGGMVGGEHG